MRNYATISPLFWTGETGKKIRALGAETQVLALYLVTSPHSNMLGLYYCPIPFICHETGLSNKGALKGLQSLSEVGFCSYDGASEHVFVYEMARFQIADSLKETDNRVKGIRKAYEALANNAFLFDFFERYSSLFHLEKQRGSEGAPKPGTGTGTGTGTGKGWGAKKTAPKTTAKKATQAPDVFPLTDNHSSWAKKNGITVNLSMETDKFLDFHRAKGSTFKDWLAAWRNWMRKAQEFSNNDKPINGQNMTPRQSYMRDLGGVLKKLEERKNENGNGITCDGTGGNVPALESLS